MTETERLDPIKTQVGGDHYKGMAIQPVEYAMANKLNACEFGILKYVSRHRLKGGAEDVRKIIHFAQLLLKLEYGSEATADPVHESCGYDVGSSGEKAGRFKAVLESPGNEREIHDTRDGAWLEIGRRAGFIVTSLVAEANAAAGLRKELAEARAEIERLKTPVEGEYSRVVEVIRRGDLIISIGEACNAKELDRLISLANRTARAEATSKLTREQVEKAYLEMLNSMSSNWFSRISSEEVASALHRYLHRELTKGEG